MKSKIKNYKSITLGLCLVCLTPSSARAQPKVTVQPNDEVVNAGQNASLTIRVSGTPPLTYQWFLNGETLAGATSPILAVTNAQPVPHHFRGIAVAPEKTVALSLDGSVSNMFTLSSTVSDLFMQMFDFYVVEASSNLMDWTRLATLLRTNNDPNPLLFQESNAPSLSQRFYRTFTNHLVTAFPNPTGPFGVGTLQRIVTDSSRSNRYGIKTNSAFMSTFWYPTDPPGTGSLPGPYTDREIAADRNLYSFWGWSAEWTNVAPRCVAHSLADVPLASGTNRFPVILHSHGWTCDRRLNTQSAEELASRGYIVAAVDHEDCHVTVYPDNRGVRYVFPGSRTDFNALFPSRVEDIQYLLEELSKMAATDPLLAGRLDLDRVGMMGFSMGGGTAAETCRTDARVKCVALLDPYIPFAFPFYTNLYNRGIQKPFLAMNRTILDHSNILQDFSPASLRLYTLATNDAVWLKITNTGHFAFSDLAWSAELTSYSRRGALAINACLLWFFDKYLKQKSGPFPTLPEVTALETK